MVQRLDDRRQPNRLPDPACSKCLAPPARVKVISRTDDVVHFRCQACDHTWSLPKPNPGPGGLLDSRD